MTPRVPVQNLPDTLLAPEVRDLYDAAVALRAHVPSPMIKSDCTRVIRTLRRVVLYEWHTKAEGDLHGIKLLLAGDSGAATRGIELLAVGELPVLLLAARPSRG